MSPGVALHRNNVFVICGKILKFRRISGECYIYWTFLVDGDKKFFQCNTRIRTLYKALVYASECQVISNIYIFKIRIFKKLKCFKRIRFRKVRKLWKIPYNTDRAVMWACLHPECIRYAAFTAVTDNIKNTFYGITVNRIIAINHILNRYMVSVESIFFEFNFIIISIYDTFDVAAGHRSEFNRPGMFPVTIYDNIYWAVLNADYLRFILKHASGVSVNLVLHWLSIQLKLIRIYYTQIAARPQQFIALRTVPSMVHSASFLILAICSSIFRSYPLPHEW